MRRTLNTILALSVLASCSVREDRMVCPASLELTVTRQVDSIYQNGLAWCYVWSEEKVLIASSPLEGMNGRDTMLRYEVPRTALSVVSSSREMTGGCVVAERDSCMCELWAFRLDVDSRGEKIVGIIDRVDRQFCNLTILLSKDAMPYVSALEVIVLSPYNGTVFPSLAAHAGDFLYATAFDSRGRAFARLPRQGGPGLVLSLADNGGSFASNIDLYDYMVQAGYDWTATSLCDFTVTVGLNSAGGEMEIIDWDVEEIGDREF